MKNMMKKALLIAAVAVSCSASVFASYNTGVSRSILRSKCNGDCTH